MKFILLLSLFLFGFFAHSTAVTTGINVLSYTTTNVTTSAYVVLLSSTPKTVSTIEVCDSSGQLLKFAIGATGSEVDKFTNFISGCVLIKLNPPLPAGTQLNVKAISASATSGFDAISFLL